MILGCIILIQPRITQEVKGETFICTGLVKKDTK